MSDRLFFLIVTSIFNLHDPRVYTTISTWQDTFTPNSNTGKRGTTELDEKEKFGVIPSVIVMSDRFLTITNIGLLSYTFTAIATILCRNIEVIDIHTCKPISMTLTYFQGHSKVTKSEFVGSISGKV